MTFFSIVCYASYYLKKQSAAVDDASKYSHIKILRQFHPAGAIASVTC